MEVDYSQYTEFLCAQSELDVIRLIGMLQSGREVAVCSIMAERLQEPRAAMSQVLRAAAAYASGQAERGIQGVTRQIWVCNFSFGGTQLS